jgi:hypothetical protein
MSSDHGKSRFFGTEMYGLVCPNCEQLWLTTASSGEQFRCRECRYAFRVGEDSPLSAIESLAGLRARPDRSRAGAEVTGFEILVEQNAAEPE